MRQWLRQKWHSPGGMGEVLKVAWPLILSNSFWTFQLALDRILLSRYSSAAVGAAQAAALLFWTPLTLLQFTANYSTTFVAQYVGAQQLHRVGPAVWQALHFAIVSGVAFLIGMWALAPTLVEWAGHPPALQPLEVEYLRCLSFVGIFFLIVAAISGFFAGRGDSRTVMLINGIGVLVNAPLTYAWIYGEWGFPQMGIAGAGWSTVVGTGVAALLAMALFCRKKYRVAFATLKGWRLELGLFRRLLYYGFPSGMTSALEAGAFSLAIIYFGRMGTPEMAATSIAFTLNLFIYLPTAGLGQAVGIMVGQGQGKRNPALGERAASSGLILAFGFTAVVAALLLGIPHLLVEIFHSQGDPYWGMIAQTVPNLLIFVAVYSAFDCMNLVYSFGLRGAGDTRFVTQVMLVAPWPLLVYPTYAAWKYGWGLYWGWSFLSVYAIFLGVIYWLRFRHGKWRSMRVIEDTVEPEPLEEPLRVDQASATLTERV